MGRDALRMLPCNREGRIQLHALRTAVAADRAAGLTPFLVVGTAGSVDIGAVDDLSGLAAFCRDQSIWFHVDAAFGAIALLAPRLRTLFVGIEQADSVAFDFHKWAQVPYDAGCIVVRDAARQLAAFAQGVAYLRRDQRGLAGGGIWPCDLGPDLSRGFRALKVWMTFQVYGADIIGAIMQQCCDVAQRLAARTDREPELQRLAPVALNIVCFRYPCDGMDLDRLNAEIIADIQEAGISVPSVTTIDGRLAIRAAVVNHRTETIDADNLIGAVLRAGRQRQTRAA